MDRVFGVGFLFIRPQGERMKEIVDRADERRGQRDDNTLSVASAGWIGATYVGWSAAAASDRLPDADQAQDTF